MQAIEKLCQLCADDLDVSTTLDSCGDPSTISEIVKTELDSASFICSGCSLLVTRIHKFAERCKRAQKLLSFLKTSIDADCLDLAGARKQFGLMEEEKANRSTDTVDLDLDIKNEFIDSQDADGLGCDDSFNELEDFAEISTMALQDDYVIDAEEIEDGVKGAVIESNCEIREELEDGEAVDEKIKYSCHVCPEKLTTFFSLQSHCRKDHQTNAEILCSCGAMLVSRAQLHLHKKLHKSEKVFPCKICDKMYSHQQSLHNHMRKVHPDSEKSVFTRQCKQCPKQFESEKKLKTHEQVHLPNEKKFTVTCPFCDKRFTKSVNVQAHIKAIHQMERPFLCSDCGKDFSTKGALKEHQIIHSTDFPFQCRFCPKKFKNLPRLKTHEDIHNNTQYICNICGISLNTKRTLKMHMVVHSDQKKYKCQYCGSSFKRSKALKNHLILHSGLRPYSCPWCDKTFANGSNCRSHKKKAHPTELAAMEASGKLASTAPNIPRLEQLQPKAISNQPQQFITVDGTNVILQQLPLLPSEMKQELPSLQVVQHSDSFQVHQIIHTTSPILSSRVFEPSTQ